MKMFGVITRLCLDAVVRVNTALLLLWMSCLHVL